MILCSSFSLITRRWLVVAAFLVAVFLPASAKASDASDVELAPGAAISATSGTVFRKLAPRRLTLQHGKSVVAQVISLQSGRIRVTAQDGAVVMVHAQPSVNAICVRGEMLFVREAGETMIANIEGTTLLAGRASLTEIAPGTIRSWSRGLVAERNLLSAPAPVAERSLWVDTGTGVALSGLSWPKVAGARAYEVWVSKAGQQIASIETTEPRLRASGRTLGKGRYDVRVRAIDEQGFAGKVSAALPVRVIGLSLPLGAGVDDDGTVRLGEGQQVTFSHDEGIAITAGQNGRYKSVRGGVGLEQGSATMVWFRTEGSPRPEAWVRLQPRGFDAKVRIRQGAKGWPSEPLFIAVHVRGEGGRPAPDWLQPKPHVTLGVESVELEWKRRGDGMYAVLSERPKTPGPWVVRVAVDDQYGVPIARDFFEIASEEGR